MAASKSTQIKANKKNTNSKNISSKKTKSVKTKTASAPISPQELQQEADKIIKEAEKEAQKKRELFRKKNVEASIYFANVLRYLFVLFSKFFIMYIISYIFSPTTGTAVIV